VLDPCLFKLIIKEISSLIHNKKSKDENKLDDKTSEINAITTVIGNLVFPRVDIKSDLMFLNYLRTIWPTMKLPYKYEYELES
jgi:hypothetical protein